MKRILYLMQSARLSVDAARTQLEKVLASPGFARNERMSRFLRFLVEQHLKSQDSELKETLIAIQVFGRKPDYDPKLDSIVRTEATRLRARLAEYYAGEGSDDAIVIEIPKGGYVPLISGVEGTTKGTASSRSRLGQWLWIAITAGVLLTVAATTAFVLGRERAPVNIAVLPLENLGRDPANDYFVDGLTAEIIRNLSVIDGLSVRSQTSSFAFRGKPRDVREAGRQLDADYVVEGSVLRAGDQLRIDAQLVRVHDDSPLWSGRFDRELSDVFAIQDEISRGIVNSLRLKLGRNRRRYETSVEAYDLYLRALNSSSFNFNEEQQIALLNQAIAKDGAFAPAYAAKASVYWYFSQDRRMDPDEALPKMRSAAEKAVQLDPLLAEAHAAMGIVYARSLEWKDAENSFRRAIQIDPNNSIARDDYAMTLLWELGRVDEAVRELHIAQKGDPLSLWIHSDLTWLLISAGRYDEAARNAEAVLAAHEPHDWGDSRFLARARFFQSRTEEAIRMFREQGKGAEGFLGFALARTGQREEAEKLLSAHPNRPNQHVLIYAGLGDKDRVFEALDRMLAVKDERVRIYLTYPELSLIRGDPRLKTFRKKAGLPE